MDANSQAIIIFCSHLSVPDSRVRPLEASEWSDLAEKLMTKHLTPRDILEFGVQDFISELGLDEEYSDRLMRLMDRSAGLFSEVRRCLEEGIGICTRADRRYPTRLKRKLKQKCPPLFYYSGDMSISGLRVMSYAGSRHADSDDERFTRDIVKRTCSHRFGVVSGGATAGVDYAAADTALAEGWPVIEYVAGGMTSFLRKKTVKDSVSRGQRLVLSASVPDAAFSVELAASRNKYIYTQADAGVIVRADLEEGSTWSGAVENLSEGWCPLFCRDADYPGNRELIRRGAIAISNEWSVNVKTLAGSRGRTCN